MVIDSMALADEAGLHYVSEGSPGYRRIRRGRGFGYVAPDGVAVEPEVKQWIESLAIPPAWADVWISTDRSGHILATGYDRAGRKQYIYHPEWESIRDEAKFDRMGEFGRRLGRLRRRLDFELRQPGLSKHKVTALAVSVLDRTLIRVGNPQYAEENDAYGLTTLTPEHVDVDGIEVNLQFAGKGGADHQLVFRDRRLAGLIARCQELDGQTLFCYPGEDGVVSITSTRVNRYLAEAMEGSFTAKDFRTWGASTCVAESLVSDPDDEDEARLIRAIDVAAEKLGNTRAVCRSSYVHPVIPEAFFDGRLTDAWRRSRRGRWLTRAESAVNRLVGARSQ
jgi:DNA topoisomerase-1